MTRCAIFWQKSRSSARSSDLPVSGSRTELIPIVLDRG
jgi:hypothetical protein